MTVREAGSAVTHAVARRALSTGERNLARAAAFGCAPSEGPLQCAGLVVLCLPALWLSPLVAEFIAGR